MVIGPSSRDSERRKGKRRFLSEPGPDGRGGGGEALVGVHMGDASTIEQSMTAFRSFQGGVKTSSQLGPPISGIAAKSRVRGFAV